MEMNTIFQQLDEQKRTDGQTKTELSQIESDLGQVGLF